MSTVTTRLPAYSWASTHRALAAVLTVTLGLAIVVALALVLAPQERPTPAVDSPQSSGVVAAAERCAGHRCAR